MPRLKPAMVASSLLHPCLVFAPGAVSSKDEARMKHECCNFNKESLLPNWLGLLYDEHPLFFNKLHPC